MPCLSFIQEQKDLMVFTGNILGVIPFRDRCVGRTQTRESRENIEAMKEIAEEVTIFPSILESEQFKRAIRNGVLLSDINYSDLQFSFEKIIEVLENE